MWSFEFVFSIIQNSVLFSFVYNTGCAEQPLCFTAIVLYLHPAQQTSTKQNSKTRPRFSCTYITWFKKFTTAKVNNFYRPKIEDAKPYIAILLFFGLTVHFRYVLTNSSLESVCPTPNLFQKLSIYSTMIDNSI